MKPSKTKIRNTLLITAAIGVIFSIALIFIADHSVNAAAEGKIFESAQEIPAKKTALLLGSNKYIADGRENLFYNYRIDAAAALYHAKKVEFVLVSGDNGTVEYSEPELMKTDLIAEGIPEENIYLDFAGFRTWDSVIRANKVFLENDFIVISQEFHNQRALYAAKANNIDAIAFNAKAVPVAASPRIWLRERLARVKALLDAAVNTEPKFLGEEISII